MQHERQQGFTASSTYVARTDGSCITKTYDSFGRLATETNARGMVKTLSYVSTTGELSGMVFTEDAAPAQAFTYTLTGKLASVSDAAGERVFTYNEYDELVSDCLTADEILHLITENRDAFGRSIGFDYAKAGSAASSEQYGYGTDGRLATAAFSHGGESKSFGFSYLAGSGLLQTLTMPNGMTLTQQYEENRDLLTGMLYKRGTSGVVERYYSYDTLGRPLTRQQNRQGGSRSDTFMHNDRSELTSATIGSDSYAYAYDNIGNRKTAQENAEEVTNYDANALNQYTAVGEFVPEFDADGNQTKVQTSTGIWDVTYNAENRPTMFSRVNEDGTTTQVTCAYDYMGRRATKKVETLSAPNAETGESTTTLHQRYLYRGYLQIACCDLTRENHPHLWLITWDPTQSPRRPVGGLDNSGAVAPEGRGRNGVRPSQPVATRPLAIRKDGTWYCYGWDLTKNVCEVFSNEGYLNNTVVYSYTPYGAVTAEGSVTQPIQWSSEFYDDELGLVYYNYRHYNSADGRWMRIAPLVSEDEPIVWISVMRNLYEYVRNSTIRLYDRQGMALPISDCKRIMRKAKTNPSSLSQGIAKLMKSINQHEECKLTRLDCECVHENGLGVLGGFTPEIANGRYSRRGQIVMYSSSISNVRELIGVLQHELVHAWQNCNTDRNKEIEYLGACRASVCRELAAYREDGMTTKKNHPGKGALRRAIINRAAASAASHCKLEYPYMDDEQAFAKAREVATQNYERCAKKYYPDLY